MFTKDRQQEQTQSRQAGMTLVEVVMSMAISAVAVGCIVTGYLFSVTSIEKSSNSLAASAMAQQRLEQTRAAQWDIQASPPVDELVSTNFPEQSAVLDVPRSGSNFVHAINYTTITVISTNPALKMIQVDCVWPFMNHGLFTNSLVTYRRAD